MFFIYILYSESSDRFYIGYTSSIENRIIAHNHPQNKGWTSAFMPWRLVYTEKFEFKHEAMERERKLKSLKSKILIKKLVKLNP